MLFEIFKERNGYRVRVEKWSEEKGSNDTGNYVFESLPGMQIWMSQFLEEEYGTRQQPGLPIDERHCFDGNSNNFV